MSRQKQIRGKKIYTYGPIIHNEIVVNDLRQKGVEVIESEEELASLKDGIVVIRSHGVAKHIYESFWKKIRLSVWMLPVLLLKKFTESLQKKARKAKKLLLLGMKNIRKWKESKGGPKQK